MTDEELAILRAMTPEQKLKAAQWIYESAWQLKLAWIRAQHPDWSDEQVHAAVREAFLYARS